MNYTLYFWMLPYDPRPLIANFDSREEISLWISLVFDHGLRGFVILSKRERKTTFIVRQG
jgi:hypothetical protein